MFLADFHIHSTYSDGHLRISEIVDFYGRRGFGAIAITDHLCETKSFLGKSAHWLKRTLTVETFAEYIEEIRTEAERAWQQYRMVVLPGYEVTKNSLVNHRSAHILAIGATTAVSPDGDPLQIARDIRSLGALAIAAHPVHTGKNEPQTYHLWNNREEWRNEFDAWEVASGPILFRQVLTSGLKMIASSDLHHPKQMTSWKTKMRTERHAEAILQAIRDQEIDFEFYQDPYAQPLISKSAASSLVLSHG
jgi:3',5'-nucleoside bisphosphate phosphatase